MLSNYQLKILKEIGIVVWFERSRPGDDETGENKTSIKSISLRISHCEKCVLIYSQSDEVFAKRFVKDLMGAFMWRSNKNCFIGWLSASSDTGLALNSLPLGHFFTGTLSVLNISRSGLSFTCVLLVLPNFSSEYSLYMRWSTCFNRLPRLVPA